VTVAEWTSSYITDLPDSAFACVDADGRHYPHHDAAGKLDAAHLRNALSRVAQAGTASCGRAHLEAHAKKAGVGEKADRSFDELRQLVSDALRQSRGAVADMWVVEMYDDRAVYSEGGKHWEVPYTVAGSDVTFGERQEVQRVVEYKPMAVKFTKGSDREIRGLAIPFGGPIDGKDIDGEDFGSDTDLCLDWFPSGRPILYHHGLDGAVKTTVVGHQTELEIVEDEGAWVKAELDKRSRYYERIKALIAKGALGFSSGAMPHLVKYGKNGHIERWPWVELSLTPTPAHPGAVVYAVKATSALFADADDDGGSGPEPFDDHAGRVASDVGQLIERAQKRVELRGSKVGRELSASNRQELESLHEKLRDLLDRTAPRPSQKDIDELDAELAVSELRRAGLDV
jgi:hypothetical protein